MSVRVIVYHPLLVFEYPNSFFIQPLDVGAIDPTITTFLITVLTSDDYTIVAFSVSNYVSIVTIRPIALLLGVTIPAVEVTEEVVTLFWLSPEEVVTLFWLSH